MLELGKPVGRVLLEMPVEVLTDSVPGKFYHLRIQTSGVSDEQSVASKLVSELMTRFRAKVVWIRISEDVIDVQLEGSPFAWAALIAFIPTILAILGVSVILVSVYSVVSAIPSWAWALLIVGVGLIFIGPTISKSLKAGYKEYRVKVRE